MENKLATKRGDNGATKFFAQGSHQRNLTVVYIVQNLFNQDPAMRTISLNRQYMVLFKERARHYTDSATWSPNVHECRLPRRLLQGRYE
jgi:hypothetical protein